MTVRDERSGWRDEVLSRRHRLWGFDCPMVDIDFIVVEYDLGMPKALIEYKHEDADLTQTHIRSLEALQVLADNSKIPFLMVIYKGDCSRYRIIPRNSFAKNWFPEETTLPEKEYVSFLYRLRGRVAPPEILKLLSEVHVEIPKEDESKTVYVMEDDWLPEYWPFDNKEQYLEWLRE